MKAVLSKIATVSSCMAIVGLLMMSLCTKETSLTGGTQQLGALQGDSSATVRIITPYSGTIVCLGDTVQILAEVGDTAYDSSGNSWHGTVSFYQNSVLIGKDSIAPYQCIWKPATAGIVTLSAKAVSGSTTTVSAPETVTVRDAFISISSPYNYQTFSPGDTISIVANPIGTSRHTVRSVDFYRNGAILGTVSASPFVYVWKNAAQGSYTLKVVAHDTKGKLDSAVANISVVHFPPQVWIGRPVNGDVFYKGDTVKISAWAPDSNGTITRVVFFKNKKLIGSITQPSYSGGPFEFLWFDTAQGTFTLTAKAYDKTGDSGVSAPVTIERKDGFIVLTSPSDSQKFLPGSAIPISASAVEARYHTIKSVKFLRNNSVIATFAAAPYSFLWKNAATGTYQIKAIASDTKGKLDTSDVAAIIVRNNPSLLFLSLGGPTGITTAEYLKSDSLVLWAQTRDSMGGGINSVKFYENGKLIATRIGFPYSYSRSLKNTALGSYTYYAVAVDSFGGTATSNVDTVRVVSAIPKITLLGPDTNSVLHPNDTFSVIAVVNGFSSISYVKFMIDSSRIIVDSTDPYSITLSGLTPGVHWINAIVRDGAGREYSSNYLYIYVQQSISYDPVVFITSPLDSSVFSSTSTILIKADASSPNDSVSQVQFYRDSVLLGIDFAAPFSYSWKRPAKGIYFLRAVARDTKGRTGSSNGVKVTVQ